VYEPPEFPAGHHDCLAMSLADILEGQASPWVATALAALVAVCIAFV